MHYASGISSFTEESTIMYLRPRGHDLCRATPWEFVKFLVACMDLLIARWDAHDRGDPALALLPLSHFRRKDVPASLLLWLLYQGHVEHHRSSRDGPGGC